MTERLFRVSWLWRTFFPVGGLALVSVLAFGLSETLADPAAGAAQRNTVVGLLVAFAALFVACVWFGFRGGLAIGPDRVRYRSFGAFREWLFADLSGFRIPPKEARALCILSRMDGGRALRVPAVFERPAEILAALGARLPDLDLSEARAESEALRRERDLEIRSGRTPSSLGPVRLACRVLNALALVALFGGILRPKGLGPAPELALLVLAILVAPAAWALKLAHPDVVRLESRRGSELPSLEFALVGGLLAPIVPALRDYAVLDAAAPAAWGAILAVCAVFALTRADASIGKRKVVVVLLLAACFAWGYGSLVDVNGALDAGAPAAFPTRVVRKSFSEHSQSVFVAPFGKVAGETELDVPRRVFDGLKEGDSVSVLTKPGALGFPWVAGVRPGVPKTS